MNFYTKIYINELLYKNVYICVSCITLTLHAWLKEYDIQVLILQKIQTKAELLFSVNPSDYTADVLYYLLPAKGKEMRKI